MTERERLIELIRNAPKTDTVYGDIRLKDPVPTLQTIADHLLSNGVIVPPCKVGDIVYAEGWWWRDGKDIVAYQITNITITQNKKGEWTKKYRAMRFENEKTVDIQLNFSFEEIGKTVFLTKEEAEKALKERSEGK